MGLLFGLLGAVIGIVISVVVSCLIPKKAVYGTIRLIGLDEETGQFDAGVTWPEVDDIAKSKYVVLEVIQDKPAK